MTAVQASMTTMDQTTAEAPYCRGIQPIHHAAAVYISVPGTSAISALAHVASRSLVQTTAGAP